MPQSNPSCCVTPAQVGRVDLVVQALTQLPRRQIRGLFDHGCVSVNGQVCPHTHTRVLAGDQVVVRFDPQQRYHEKPQSRKDPFFKLVYEDEHLLVVDKAAGILTVPKGEPDGDEHTLMARVSLHATRGMARDRAFPCHRLDRGVSGLLVVGKTAKIASLMRDQFEAHKPMRVYYAIVSGIVTQQEGTFRSYLATGGNLDRYSTPNPQRDKGQLAITHYRVDKPLGDATLVQVKLETGRRNQIRVHFAEAGHPVLGDDRYEPELAAHPRWKPKRLALHAFALGFEHPLTHKPMRFEAALPETMVRFIRGARSSPPIDREALRAAAEEERDNGKNVRAKRKVNRKRGSRAPKREKERWE